MNEYQSLNHTQWECIYHVGRDEAVIRACTRNQEKEDENLEQLQLPR